MNIIMKNVCLLLEMLSITMCLHQLYGEKYRLDIATVSLLAIDMIMMQVIDYLGLPTTLSVLIYPIIAIYCGVRFGFQLKSIVVNMLLCVILIGGIQLLVALPLRYVFGLHKVASVELMAIILVMFSIVVFCLPRIKIQKLSLFLQNKEKVLLIALIVCMVVILFSLGGYKKIDWVEFDNTFILFICISFILVLSVQLVKYKVKAKEAEIELKMNQVYSESFQGLIDHIRVRQHEFDNHIHTIYSQHYSNHTYEDLVRVQKDYCEQIVEENRFNKLLAHDNPVIRGFLYGRFIEIDKMGIEVSYQIAMKEFDLGIPIYKLVEMLGDLINNAVDALMADEERNKLYVSIVEEDGLQLEIRNESPYITYEMRSWFFEKGYSKKGESRGLGLYNVKQICEKYGFDIFCDNKEIDGSNWISFVIKR